MRNIRQRLFFAFVYNAARILPAAGVLYPAFGCVGVSSGQTAQVVFAPARWWRDSRQSVRCNYFITDPWLAMGAPRAHVSAIPARPCNWPWPNDCRLQDL